MNIVAVILAYLMRIDWKQKGEDFVFTVFRRNLNEHVSEAAQTAAAEGWSYASTTRDRPTAPHALLGDLTYRFEKHIVIGGDVRDFVRDMLEPSISAIVAPQITPETPMVEIAQKVADAGYDLVTHFAASG